ncbi:hypothetical protein [Laspinema olomoucense]|nr:hypothetical protein [Laspinema sp. D3c]
MTPFSQVTRINLPYPPHLPYLPHSPIHPIFPISPTPPPPCKILLGKLKY